MRIVIICEKLIYIIKILTNRVNEPQGPECRIFNLNIFLGKKIAKKFDLVS